MKTPLAIGLGLACFAAGALAMKLFDPSDPKGSPVEVGPGEGAITPHSRQGRGVSGLQSSGGGGAREVTGEEVVALLDVRDHIGSERKLRERLSGFGAEELIELLRSVDLEVGGPKRDLAMQLIGKRFGEIDPEAAFEFATDPRNRRFGHGILNSAISAMLLESPEGALATVLSVEGRRIRKSAISNLIEGITSSHPELVGKWFKDEEIAKQLSSHPWYMRRAMKNWGAQSPEEAAAFVMTLPPGQIRKGGIDGVAEIWAQQDPDAALAWANGIEDRLVRDSTIREMVDPLVARNPQLAFDLLGDQAGEERDSMLASIGSSLVGRDPDLALEWFSGLDDPKDLAEAMGGARYSMHLVDPEGFAALISRLPEEERDEVGRDFVGQWAGTDPAAARAWVSEIEDPKLRESYAQSVVGNLSWEEPELAIEMISTLHDGEIDIENYVEYAFGNLAERDLGEARSLVEGIEDPELRGQASQAIVSAWAKQDPQGAAEFVDSQNAEGPERRDMVREIAREWVNRDVDATLAWASGLPISERAAVTNEAISELVRDDQLDVAQRTLMDLIGESPDAVRGDRLNGAIQMVVSRIASDDPRSGIELINQLPTEESQRQATGILAGEWAEDDLDGASEWVGGLPAGIVRDAAVERVVREHHNENENHARSFELATSLDNQDRRRNLMRQTVDYWSRRDLDATREAIEAADVSDEERQNLLDRLD